MEKYQNKYRIPSARATWWDYGWAGAYFITICTHNRMHYFGEIVNGKMNYTPVGAIAYVLWYEILYHTQNVELGAFVVMPNHIHGILILNGNNENDKNHGNEKNETQQSNTQKRFQNLGKNTVSAIIGSYKSAVTRHTHRLGFEFKWQTRFHDHIIRNDTEYQRINDYIETNPLNWDQDKYFKRA